MDLSDHDIFRRHALSIGMREWLLDAWLAGKNTDSFGGGTPLEALNEGRLLEVIEAANAFCAARPSDVPPCTCASHGLAAEFRHGSGCRYGQAIRYRAWEAERV